MTRVHPMGSYRPDVDSDMAVARLEHRIQKYPKEDHMAFFLRDVAARNVAAGNRIHKNSRLLACTILKCKPKNRVSVLQILLDAGYVVAPQDVHIFIYLLLAVPNQQVQKLFDAYWPRLVASGLDINRDFKDPKLNLLLLFYDNPPAFEWLLHHGADPSKMPDHINLYDYLEQAIATHKGDLRLRNPIILTFCLLNAHAKTESFRLAASKWRSHLTEGGLSRETIQRIINFVQ